MMSRLSFINSAPKGLALLAIAAIMAMATTAWLGSAYAQGAIVITSERFSADRDEGAALFEGSVVVRNENMILSADSMTAYYGQTGSVSNIVAEGKVKLVKGLQVLTSERAVYEVAGGRMIFTVDPKAVDEGRVLEGESIEYFPDEEKIKVSESRVFIESGPGGEKGGNE